jgi:hypothetical protein
LYNVYITFLVQPQSWIPYVQMRFSIRTNKLTNKNTK